MNTDTCRTALPAGASVSNCINVLVSNECRKPYGPFGTKPVRASVFISVLMLFYADALAGIAKPARASAFNSL